MTRWLDDGEKILKYWIEEFRKRRGLTLVGSCKMCGKCCEGKNRVFNFYPDSMTAEAVGVKETICPHFNTLSRRCEEHNADLPILCQLFPYLPEVLYPGCGFHFEKEGKIFLTGRGSEIPKGKSLKKVPRKEKKCPKKV